MHWPTGLLGGNCLAQGWIAKMQQPTRQRSRQSRRIDGDLPIRCHQAQSIGTGSRAKHTFLRTDQDNALVFEDVPEEQLAAVKKYYLALSEKVTKMLFECGFDYCPGNMMASNPEWCLSLAEWKAQSGSTHPAG
ncbi:MAG: hypothetical protein HC838_07485 [Spirulinaceae cyanobacterium RM2_2_10]|nr:hypothetical protein [Spirulinaceae cyanobacterium RM2_2_10]